MGSSQTTSTTSVFSSVSQAAKTTVNNNMKWNTDINYFGKIIKSTTDTVKENTQNLSLAETQSYVSNTYNSFLGRKNEDAHKCTQKIAIEPQNSARSLSSDSN